MTLQENAYSAFMLDHAAGALSRAEALVAELHRRLSPDGAAAAALLDAAGGALLESAAPEPTAIPLREPAPVRWPARLSNAELDVYLSGDLLGLPWRKTFFGVQTLTTPVPRTRLLRLDPGERAPQHGHGVRDVTVVLRGAFADEFGVYKRGDLAFAEPGVKHGPSAMGDEPCVCLIAAEPGPMVSEWVEAITWTGFPMKRKSLQ
jgi:putative transcriptional regulator